MAATTTTVTSTPFTDIGVINEVAGTPCTPGWSPPPGPSPGPGYTPPLDDYSNAAAAYSVRLLRTAYSGSALRVRRTVAPFDEQDIGFTAGGDLDEAAIVAFGGSDVLTVSGWYDQSGQSNDATQITPGAQPEIYNGTAVITENGKPALNWDALNRLDTGNIVTDDLTASIVCRKETSTVVAALFSIQTGFNNGYELIYVPTNSLSYRVTSSDLDTTLTQEVQSIVFVSYDGSTQQSATNGTNSTKSSTQSFTLSHNLNIGSRVQGGTNQLWRGTMQEFIIYANATYADTTNRTGIETNIMTYYNIP